MQWFFDWVDCHLAGIMMAALIAVAACIMFLLGVVIVADSGQYVPSNKKDKYFVERFDRLERKLDQLLLEKK